MVQGKTALQYAEAEGHASLVQAFHKFNTEASEYWGKHLAMQKDQNASC